MHLDTVCTMVDVDAVVMYPAVQDSLCAFAIRKTDGGGVSIGGPDPFLRVAADAMGIGKLRVVDTGLTVSPPNANSGTTATTRSRSRPVSSSPTSAMR